MPNKINEIGNRYGKLLVIGPAPNKNNKVRWTCQCDCGNIIEVYGHSLRIGRANSCGCSRVKPMIGKKFGFLTVIDKSEKRSTKNEYYWKCQCECGTITEVRGSKLRNGDTWSCGCIRSKSERKIIDFFQKNNIEYKKEYSFEDLVLKNNLRFDFAVFKNQKLLFLIEFQGEQHFNNRTNWGTLQRELTDTMKIDYCKNHNIDLKIITYKDDLEEELKKILNEVKENG